MRAPPRTTLPLLARYEGESLYAGAEAIVKGLLEAETPANLLAGPALEPFDAMFALTRDDETIELVMG